MVEDGRVEKGVLGVSATPLESQKHLQREPKTLVSENLNSSREFFRGYKFIIHEKLSAFIGGYRRLQESLF